METTAYRVRKCAACGGEITNYGKTQTLPQILQTADGDYVEQIVCGKVCGDAWRKVNSEQPYPLYVDESGTDLYPGRVCPASLSPWIMEETVDEYQDQPMDGEQPETQGEIEYLPYDPEDMNPAAYTEGVPEEVLAAEGAVAQELMSEWVEGLEDQEEQVEDVDWSQELLTAEDQAEIAAGVDLSEKAMRAQQAARAESNVPRYDFRKEEPQPTPEQDAALTNSAELLLQTPEYVQIAVLEIAGKTIEQVVGNVPNAETYKIAVKLEDGKVLAVKPEVAEKANREKYYILGTYQEIFERFGLSAA